MVALFCSAHNPTGSCIRKGDIFRYNIKNKTPIGKKAKSYIDAGKLVPDEVVLDMVKDAVSTDECRTKGWLLDGFPRTALQVGMS